MPFLNGNNNAAFSFIDNNTLEQNELQGDSHFQGFRKTHVSDFRICSKTGFHLTQRSLDSYSPIDRLTKKLFSDKKKFW